MGLGLHLVTVEMTGRCNLSCSHCYRWGNEQDDLIDFDLLIDQLSEIKPYYITVSGGEPLLLSDIFYLSEKLKNVCQKKRLHMETLATPNNGFGSDVLNEAACP
jgi:MoaA/NifB/PqqE/SkfB family radical SAM enzyme